MPITRIRVGELDVFESGAVTASADDALEFTLEHPDDPDAMSLAFEFLEDGGEARMDPGEVGPDGTATLQVYNHVGGEGIGPTDPFNVGVFAGRALHLTYHVDTITPGEPATIRFAYTFYLGREVDPAEVSNTDG